jgi:alkanesulfonate monooxygenase SsuD/methylene tetrahydromethanopterin reductase-like flavin-dependent oxidoreductase (luciferase family)
MRRRLEALRAACQAAGRDFSELEISCEAQILIAPSRDAVRQKLRAMLALTPPGVDTFNEPDFLAFVNGSSDEYPRALRDGGLVGTPAEVAGQLRDNIALGVTHFMLWFLDAPDPAGLELFAQQVAPLIRSGA